MSNLSDLKAALVVEANTITFNLDKLECLADIDAWYNATTAVNALSASNVTSYSIAGRTVTRANLTATRNEASQLLTKIKERLYGSGGLAEERYSDTGATNVW